MNILVTGSAGFIGSHISDFFIEEGHTVIGLDDLSSGDLKNKHKQQLFFEMDLLEIDSLFERHDIDLVIHCAAQTNVRVSLDDPMMDAMDNIFGSLAVLEAMRKWGKTKIIFLSTGGAIYDGNDKRPIPETNTPRPISPYGVAKYSVENYLRYYEVVHSFEPTILRLANVYGPRATKGIINICLNKFKKEETVDIFGGFQTRDYIHVSDIVSAINTVIENNLMGIFNVGTGKETTLNTIVAEVIGGNAKWATLVNKCEAKAGELAYSSLDSAKLRKWGWKPQVLLQDGIKSLKSS